MQNFIKNFIQKRRTIIGAAAAGLTFLLIVASFVLSAVSIGRSDVPKAAPDTITVYGQGVVSAAPDIAYLTLGYENSAERPQAARDANAAKMDGSSPR